MATKEWIGVDFDGTLAEHPDGGGVSKCGRPIRKMIERVQAWVAAGTVVKIVTARFCIGEPKWNAKQIALIHKFCEENDLPALPVQCHKDFNMLALYDDRAVAVEKGTGRLLSPECWL